MFINQFHYRDREREKKGALCVEVVRVRVLFVSSALPVSVCTSVKYTDYISGPFSPSVCLPVTPPHPPVRRLDRTSLTHGARLVSLVSSSSPLSPSLVCCVPVLFFLPLSFSLFPNKNNRLWNAFSCGITHRHQPPHAIRLS